MKTTKHLPDLQSAVDLDDLYGRLNQWADAIAHDVYDVDDYDSDLTSLPTFGGFEPASTEGIWSWDATRVLVSGGQITVEVSGWEIQDRD